MRDLSPGPMLSRKTVRGSIARTARKSICSAPGTLDALQLAPPSRVTSHVPPVPLANATRALTALMPRKDALVPLVCGVPLCAPARPARETKRSSLMIASQYKGGLLARLAHGRQEFALKEGHHLRPVQQPSAFACKWQPRSPPPAEPRRKRGIS